MNEQNQDQEKKVYVKPEIISLGQIEEKTHGNGSPNNDGCSSGEYDD